jgi:cell division protein ZapA (FtsZ GTPase activity inhibitor)
VHSPPEGIKQAAKMEEKDISIKVNIADVVYPMRIKPSEEENVRKGAKMINDKLRSLKDDYQLTDRQILLSMVSLQFATELLQLKEKPEVENDGISETIRQIDDLLDKALVEV